MKSLPHFTEPDYSRHHSLSAFKYFGPLPQGRDKERRVTASPKILTGSSLERQRAPNQKTDAVGRRKGSVAKLHCPAHRRTP